MKTMKQRLTDILNQSNDILTKSFETDDPKELKKLQIRHNKLKQTFAKLKEEFLKEK
jgi:hypothetical protein